MMKLFILFLLFGISQEIATNHGRAIEQWNFVKEENGVKLYSRAIEGFEYKEVKAVLDVNVDLKKAQSFLMNPKNIEKWMSGCSMSIPKKSSDNEKEYYAIFDAPWPISDRDDYGRLSVKEVSENKLHIDFKSIPEGTPQVSSMVRVPFSKGHILIEAGQGGNKTLVYQFLVDRGGSLPSYLKEYLENTSPIKTVKKLKLALESLP